MKTLIACLALSLVISISGKTQDLSGLFQFAHYPLINTPDDALGLQNPMVLTNTVYEGNDGIYFNGMHPVVDPGGSWARTTYMSALTDARFAIQVEFKIDDLDDQVRCIAICGLSTFQQYLGFFILPSNEFSILLSDGVFLDLPDLNPQENVWYKYTMIYDTVSNNAKFYLGNNLIESANHELVRIPGDAFVNNYYPSGGYPLKGNWRNLRIYGTEDLTALEDELEQDGKNALDASKSVNLFPNPVSSQLYMECEDISPSQLSITGLNDLIYLQREITDVNEPINVNLLPDGVFLLHLFDSNGFLVASRKFVKVSGE